MKNIVKIIAGCAVAVVLMIMAIMFGGEALIPATSEYEFVKESTYPISSAVPSMAGYGSLEELKKDAVLIAEIFIKSQHIELIGNTKTPATWSEAEIKQVISGDRTVKTVKIGEVGGLVNNQEYAIAGTPVMKKGNTYIVFLGKGVYANTYEIVGAIHGKIRISDETNQGVVTIDRETFLEHMDDLYWFQKTFAGKDKHEIIDTLKKL